MLRTFLFVTAATAACQWLPAQCNSGPPPGDRARPGTPPPIVIAPPGTGVSLPAPGAPNNPGPGDANPTPQATAPAPGGSGVTNHRPANRPMGVVPGSTPAPVPTVAPLMGRFGMPIDFVRQKTAQSRLSWDWDYAKVVAAPSPNATATAAVARPLPAADAIAHLANKDRRPLLVLRECSQCGCGGESDVGRKLLNEKTILLGRWFHCVRVSDGVRADTHPLHTLFAEADWPHVLVCSADGTGTVGLKGNESLSVVWRQMRRLIDDTYEGDIEWAITTLLQALSTFDYIDTQEEAIATRLDIAMRAGGQDDRHIDRLRQQLDRLAKERSTAEAAEARAVGLKLRASRVR